MTRNGRAARRPNAIAAASQGYERRRLRGLVVVPVSDVERAKRFYRSQLSFTVDHDTQISKDLRVIQLIPPGSGCSIVIGEGMSESEPGSLPGIQLVVTDIDAAREQLAARGVEVSPIRHFADGEWRDGRGGPWNSFLFFNDPDSNGWVVRERPRA